MIVVYHLNEDLPRDLRADIVTGFGCGVPEGHAAVVAKTFMDKHYSAVAVGHTDSLEEMYAWTQNGVVSDSWSMNPFLDKWMPIFPDFHLCNEKKYGRRSTMVGDVFDRNGEYYVCSTIGFTKLEMP